MKLLILTQKVDKNDPVLGFFHRWLEEFSKRFEKVTVICLSTGEYDLPGVKVLSLGKETGVSHLEYVSRFYKYIWVEKDNYNAVFVHMNQEYVLMAGLLWRLMGKKVAMWRNHQHGDVLTKLAVSLSHKVFYTSPSSFTARFNNAIKMPVGIDTDFFKPNLDAKLIPNSILFLGRIGPVKRVLEFIEWLKELNKSGETFNATIAGEALPKDSDYALKIHQKIEEYGLMGKVKFVGAVTQEGALMLYQTHEKYVNKTLAGSYDKTIFEAAACEMEVLVDNDDARKELAGKNGQELRQYVVENHSLKRLAEKLKKEINE